VKVLLVLGAHHGVGRALEFRQTKDGLYGRQGGACSGDALALCVKRSGGARGDGGVDVTFEGRGREVGFERAGWVKGVEQGAEG
jgi:hypothetical protein